MRTNAERLEAIAKRIKIEDGDVINRAEVKRMLKDLKEKDTIAEAESQVIKEREIHKVEVKGKLVFNPFSSLKKDAA